MEKKAAKSQSAWGITIYNEKNFQKEGAKVLSLLSKCEDLEQGREKLMDYIDLRLEKSLKKEIKGGKVLPGFVENCGNNFKKLLMPANEIKGDFSLLETLYSLARKKKVHDLTPAFYGEMINLIMGFEGRSKAMKAPDFRIDPKTTIKKAVKLRNENLDALWSKAERRTLSYKHGLKKGAIAKRKRRKNRILNAHGGTLDDWNDWHWHIRHIIKDVRKLKKLIDLPKEQFSAINKAIKHRIPFGVTPFYLSLMDDNGAFDEPLRVQVFFPANFVKETIAGKMKEEKDRLDTAVPVELVTRRYPSIVNFKPILTCPQICVYCGRNLEVNVAALSGVIAPETKIKKAINWISEHPAIKEILITGGDPLMVDNDRLKWILDRIVKNKNIERIRIGSRALVTLPMRITDDLTQLLSGYNKPGVREVCLMSHIQHPYEINPDMMEAATKLKNAGIKVYNQMVYTFFNSKKFEVLALRRLLGKIGIEPYYSFKLKGGAELENYMVPLARILQEYFEEAVLVSGLTRRDTPVNNLPTLGNNSLLDRNKREIIAILPDGKRVYEWKPWENNLVNQHTYIEKEMPILEYLQKLKAAGYRPEEYKSIWYYF